MRCDNCVVDDTDRTDCWHRRTGGGRSVTAGVSRRSNQNSNECGERIVRQTALGSVTVWRTAQQIDSRSSSVVSPTCMNSELGVSPRLTALSIFVQQHLTWKCREIAPPVWTQRRSRDFWSSVANRWKQVNTAGKLSRRVGGGAAGHGNAAAARSLCVHRYKQWLVRMHMQICKSTTSLNLG